MSFKVLNQLETIDNQLGELNTHDLLIVANILINSDATQLADLLGEIASLSKPLQGTVLDSIYAKVKASK